MYTALTVIVEIETTEAAAWAREEVHAALVEEVRQEIEILSTIGVDGESDVAAHIQD
jgi:hypothetical protein